MTLNCYKFEFFSEFRVASQIWEAIGPMAKRMKIDRYNFIRQHWQQQ